jgi:uncharacterized protein with FMN-binding domain
MCRCTFSLYCRSNGLFRVAQVLDVGSYFPDDADYFDVDKDGSRMIENMIAGQSAEVDTISGATYSSEGLIDAVNMALSEAMIK